jgi:glycosyltransferase involved in cell wall biosynthesis
MRKADRSPPDCGMQGKQDSHDDRVFDLSKWHSPSSTRNRCSSLSGFIALNTRLLLVTGGHGMWGMGTSIAQIASACIEAGAEVVHLSHEEVSSGSDTRQILRKLPVRFESRTAQYNKSALAALARITRAATGGRFSGARFGRHFTRRFWQRDARRHVEWADNVLIVAMPVSVFAHIIDHGVATGTPVFLRLCFNVDAAWAQKEAYRDVHQRLNHLSGIQTHSKALAARVREHLGYEGRIYEIDQYTDLEPELLALPIRDFRPDNVTLGSLGRLTEDKGVQHTLRALARIRDEEGVRPRLVVAGGGGYADELQRMVDELGLRSQVEFPGRLSRENGEIVDFFRRIDALVVPSYEFEAGPLVVTEAMAAGVPVVASRVWAIEQRIGDITPWMFEPRDDEALTAHLKAILCRLTPAGHREMGEALRRRYVERYARVHAAAKYRDMFGMSMP